MIYEYKHSIHRYSIEIIYTIEKYFKFKIVDKLVLPKTKQSMRYEDVQYTNILNTYRTIYC